jgi:hypothetical protein
LRCELLKSLNGAWEMDEIEDNLGLLEDSLAKLESES